MKKESKVIEEMIIKNAIVYHEEKKMVTKMQLHLRQILLAVESIPPMHLIQKLSKRLNRSLIVYLLDVSTDWKYSKKVGSKFN